VRHSSNTNTLKYNGKKKKIVWDTGDAFVISLKNNNFCVGHVLDQRMINTVRIALYDELLTASEIRDVSFLCKTDKLISLIEVTKEQLEYGVWKIIGNKKSDLPISKYPNELYCSENWVGSVVYDAALAEDFVNAFYALLPWDDWYDPHHLDKILVDISKKPKRLIFVKS